MAARRLSAGVVKIGLVTSIPGWQVYVWILAIALPATFHLLASRHRDGPHRAEAVLMYVLGVSGAIGMGNVAMHTIFADRVAESIGWPAGNPFQMEVGFANLAIGIIGFACFWRYDFWLPAIIAKATFMLGAGVTHVVDAARNGNLAANNVGPILGWDFGMPVVLVGLYLLAAPSRNRIEITPLPVRSPRWRLEFEPRRGLGILTRRGTDAR